jgi:excisionase family DNA binding protein
MLGVSESTIYERAKTKQIPNVGVGRTVRIPRAWLNRHLAAAGVSLAPTVRSLTVVQEGTFG